MKILLIGASGKLGRAAYQYFSSRHTVIGTYFTNFCEGLFFLDLTQPDALEDLISTEAWDVILYAAGLTDVDKCEENQELAYKCNAKPIEQIVKHTSAKLIYISTDYVFNGDKGGYSETSEPSPTNVYGMSKLAGENATLTNKRNAVVRVSGLFSYANSPNANTKSVDDNRFSSPVSIIDVCKAIELILDRDASGIFHAAGEKPLSRYEFAVVNNAVTESCQTIIPSYYTSGKMADRPLNSSLICAKLENLGWSRTPFLPAKRQKQLPLLIADCVGVCLTDRTWLKLTLEEENVDKVIRIASGFDDVIESVRKIYGYAPELTLKHLTGIANHYAPNPVFWNSLSDLKKVFRIAVVNNGLKCIFNYWKEKYQFESIFDLTVNSEEIGIRKPDPRIFDHVLSVLNSQPDNAFLWDDDEAIVSAATEFGINGILFRRAVSFPLAEYSSAEMSECVKKAKNYIPIGGTAYVES